MRSEKWTIKSPLSGEVIGEFIVEAHPVPVAEEEAPAGRTPEPAPARAPQGSKNGSSEEPMTEPQRRYLFRLLAAQKVTGAAAEKHLKDYFKVRAIGAVTRKQASEYIDQLVKDQKDANA